jgi:hypothetical protein
MLGPSRPGSGSQRWTHRRGRAAYRVDREPGRGESTRALAWSALLSSEPAFLPNATEAVWELAEHRYLYIEELPERAGHGLHTVFVDDLDDRVEGISARGVEPAARETYGNGVLRSGGRRRDSCPASMGCGDP